MPRLTRAFYDRPTLLVAEDLIGKRLVHDTAEGRASGVIVEVEAYIGESDPACHAAAGRTRRNAPLYGDPGFAYVYFNYGMHHLVNAVTEAKDSPAAVLIRALHACEGIELMRRRRGLPPQAADIADASLCRGPGNLTKALGITLAQNGLDLCRSALYIIDRGDAVDGAVVWGPRIGISVGVETPWRASIAGHRAVSGGRRRPGQS